MSKTYSNRSIWIIALALTLANAVKPMTVDDTIFYFYAQQIATAPLDPYGFDVFWEIQPVSALNLFAPVGMPYWWSLGLGILPDEPWLWKLWMFPYALLLAWALQQLLLRFASRERGPLLAMMALGPTVLPAFNLMIDIPSLALALGAMALFMKACDSSLCSTALAAGLLAALAIETKFTSFAPIAGIFAYGALARQWKVLAITSCTAVAAFAGAESWLYAQYGTSHFLRSLEIPEQWIRHNTPAGWAVGWVALAGALAGPVALLGLTSLRLGRHAFSSLIVLACIPYLAIGLGTRPRDSISFGPTQLGQGDGELTIFFAAGLAVVLTISASVAAGARRGLNRTHAFLLVWFVIELVACVAISPFHAARRLIGPIVSGTLLVAHVATASDAPRHSLRAVAAFAVSLGLLFAAADALDARARYAVHDRIATQLRELGHDPGRETVWFTGHWGFQFYAERRGYQPLIAGRSQVERGDWLLVPNRASAQPVPRISLSAPLATVAVGHSFPLSTTPSAYMAAVAIRRQPLAQNRVVIRRVESSGIAPALRRRAVRR